MKYFLGLLATLIVFSSSAQEMSYKEWNREAKRNIRLIPKYGNQPKSDKQKQADQELIDSYIAQEGSRRKASEFLINTGFNYLYAGDVKTAMYRFNQAWLLDPDNEDVFWGWGSVYFHFSDKQKALEQYNEGLTLNPRNPRLLTDKATIFMGDYYENSDVNAANMAIALFSESYSIDSTDQNTTYKLSVAYFTQKDCENALKYYNLCKQLGGKPIRAAYTDALKETCK